MVKQSPIRVAIVGVGNCASALVQGVEYYKNKSGGVNFELIGGYSASDIEFVAAWDVDIRKVGSSLHEAIFAQPNCCRVFCQEVENIISPRVRMAPILDGVSPHMLQHEASESFRLSTSTEDTVQDILSQLSTADILINYLPVGSQKASEFWASMCLQSNTAFLNCIPVFIASNPEWQQKFVDAGLPCIGDDMKSQFGASILSQMLQELAIVRGHKVQCHIQQNVGGNTDFLNMKNTERLQSKKESKENVLRAPHEKHGRHEGFLFAGPSDFIPYLGDNKIATFHIEMTGFGGSPVVLDARLSVQDSPNSAGVVIDAIRFLKVALELGISGALKGASAFTQKTPPVQMSLEDAKAECEALAKRDLTPFTIKQ